MSEIHAARERLKDSAKRPGLGGLCLVRITDLRALLDDHAALAEMWKQQRNTICTGPACPLHQALENSRNAPPLPAPVEPRELVEAVERLESEPMSATFRVRKKKRVSMTLVETESLRTLLRHIRAQQKPGLTGEHIPHMGKMVQEWYPISTAPKDGTHILAWDGCNTAHHFDNHPPTVVHWFEDGFYPSVSVFGDQPAYPAKVWLALHEQPAQDAIRAAFPEVFGEVGKC